MKKTKVVVVGPVLVIVLLLLVILVGASSPGWVTGIIVNGIIGILILLIINKLFKEIQVPINIWTFLISAIGGILGIALLIILNLMGYGEW